MYKPGIAILFLSISFCADAQRITIEQYIEQYKDIAISEMKRSGVPASITLAQGIHETESGNSDLVKKSNNHFGIKCKSTWTGENVFHDDDANGECFRAYSNAEESYRDHSDFLRSNKRYAFLFKLDASDYKGWAKGLKKAGYATNPRYPDILIKNIEQYNLQQYTIEGINETQNPDVSKSESDKEKKLPAEVSNDKVPDQNESISGPDGTGTVMTINKTKCVFAKKGTSLLAIANKNNISLNKLMEFNDLSEEGILNKDQYVYLHKKPKTGDREYYIVQPGETLYDVAQKNGIQLKYLKEYNNLTNSETVEPEDKLFLQPGLIKQGTEPEKADYKMHLVAPKEGLYAIARKYNVTVQQLKEWNKLDTDDLKIGQEIIVYK
jgi:LysM repeat protein